MTKEQIEELKKLEAKAKAAPWSYGELTGESGSDYVAIFAGTDAGSVVGQIESSDCTLPETDANAQLICAARNAMPALLARIEELEGIVGKLPTYKNTSKPFVPGHDDCWIWGVPPDVGDSVMNVKDFDLFSQMEVTLVWVISWGGPHHDATTDFFDSYEAARSDWNAALAAHPGKAE